MDLDEVAKMIREDDTKKAELVTYHESESGKIVRKTVTFTFSDDGDYQWSSSVMPISTE